MGLKLVEATVLPTVTGTEVLPCAVDSLDYKVLPGHIAVMGDGEYFPSGSMVFLYADIYDILYDSNGRVNLISSRTVSGLPGTARDMIILYNSTGNVRARNVYGDVLWSYVNQTVNYNASGQITSVSDWVGI